MEEIQRSDWEEKEARGGWGTPVAQTLKDDEAGTAGEEQGTPVIGRYEDKAESQCWQTLTNGEEPRKRWGADTKRAQARQPQRHLWRCRLIITFTHGKREDSGGFQCQSNGRLEPCLTLTCSGQLCSAASRGPQGRVQRTLKEEVGISHAWGEAPQPVMCRTEPRTFLLRFRSNSDQGSLVSLALLGGCV